MKKVYEASGYVLDPHSAVGVAAAQQLGSTPGVPMVCLACAHWAKFPDALTQVQYEYGTGADADADVHIDVTLRILYHSNIGYQS